ncbi:MAG: glycine cleavage system aminomethyltransferase GcvT [Lachnospiraceae bacterium]|nr:glycine cleavage system aminomethyltransferase GcvT [Lachnospiraceae bacterium]
MEKKTALYDKHVACGGKMVPFGGFILPVQYETGVIAEHMAVREKVGIFDVSHMGEVLCTGKDAVKYLNHLLANSYDGMYDGQARYSPMCNEHGGIVDDMIAYRINEEKFLFVPNAANKDKDFKWMQEHVIGDVKLEDISETMGQIAIQGPNSKAVVLKLAKEEDLPKKYYSATFDKEFAGKKVIISRTGYTGEFGYEIYCQKDDTPAIWDALMEAGKEYGLIPCGLGARDTLRLEAGMPLYGHEMTDDISPLEADLGIFVKMDKEEFVGKEAIEKMPLNRIRVGLKVTGRGIIREHMDLYVGDKKVGISTSGTQLPFCGGAYAMALVDVAYKEIGTKIEADVRGRRVEAEVCPLPFYKREKK